MCGHLNAGTVYALDLGSKTFKLVSGTLREEELRIRLLGKRRVELGKAVAANHGRIPESKLAEVRQALTELMAVCDQPVKGVRAIGTRALRKAENSKRVVEIAAELGIELDIADGVREASVAYLAVTAGAPRKLVVDLGSHSIQIAWCATEEVEAFSLGLGYQVLNDRYLQGGSTFAEARARLTSELEAGLENVPDDTEELIALSVSTALSWITGRSKKALVNHPVPRAALTDRLTQLQSLDAHQFAVLRADTDRAEKIFPGLIVLDCILQHSGHTSVRPAEVELPAGLIVEQFGARASLVYETRPDD